MPAIAIIGVGFALDPMMAALSGAGTPVRVITGVGLVAIAALGMGLGFPLGLRLCERIGGGDKPALGPWMWGLNGACGVVASGLALTTSMAWGIPATLTIGAGCYAALVLCTMRLLRTR